MKKIYLTVDSDGWKKRYPKEPKEQLFRRLKEAMYRQYALHKAYDVRVLTTLRDEVDKMAAYAAMELGLAYEVALPKPLEEHTACMDDDAYSEFMWLFYRSAKSDTTKPDKSGDAIQLMP